MEIVCGPSWGLNPYQYPLQVRFTLCLANANRSYRYQNPFLPNHYPAAAEEDALFAEGSSVYLTMLVLGDILAVSLRTCGVGP